MAFIQRPSRLPPLLLTSYNPSTDNSWPSSLSIPSSSLVPSPPIAEASGPPKPLSLLNINHFNVHYSACVLPCHDGGGKMDYSVIAVFLISHQTRSGVATFVVLDRTAAIVSSQDRKH